MKRTRKLLSLFLSAALVGQMGAVVGWGSGCPADHGKNQHNVTDASGCSADTHWLSGSVMTGGNGTNYYYASVGDVINCGAGTNIIVIKSLAKAGNTITINRFNKDSAIYLPPKSEFLNDGNGMIQSNGVSIMVLDGNTTPYIADAISIDTLPEGNYSVSLKEEATSGARKITATPQNQAGDASSCTYEWKRNGTLLPDTASSILVGGDPGSWTYTCTVLDGAGRAKEGTINIITGCLAEPESITAKAGDTVLKADTLLETKEDREFPLTAKVVAKGDCEAALSHDTAHGYTVTGWELLSAPAGVSLNGDKLSLKADQLTASSQEVQLKAKAANGKTEKEITISFQVRKIEECGVTPVLTIEGKTDINENTATPLRYDIKWGFENEASCNIPDHQKANHGYGNSSWSLTAPKATGEDNYIINLDQASGEITFKQDKLPAAGETLTLSVTVTDDKTKASYTTKEDITFKSRAICNAVPTSVNPKPDKAEVSFAADQLATAQTITLTPEITWNLNGCTVTHTGNDHVSAVKWSVDRPWAKLEQQPDGTAKLTITGNDLPDMENTTIATATVTSNNGNSIQGTVTIKATRGKKCDETITGFTQGEQSPISGKSPIPVTTSTVTEKFTLDASRIVTSGTCDFGTDTHDDKNHKIKWKVTGLPDNAKADAATDGSDPHTVYLTIRGNTFPEGTTKIQLQAYVEGADTISTAITVEVNRTIPTAPSYDDDDDDDSYIWESYEDKIEDAKRGSTVKMNLTGNAEVPFYIFDSARGRDVNLQMKVGNNYTWTVNGKTLKRLPAGQIFIPMDVETYKDKTLTRLCRDYDVRTFKVRHIGSFYGDMKLTVDVGVGNAKKTMYLYSYDEDKERLTYQGNALADNNGDATFVMTRSLGAYAVTSKALYGEKPVSGGGGLVGSGNGPVTVYPPVASVTTPPASSSSLPASSGSSSGSSSSESSSESSEPAPPPAPPSSSSQEPAAPVENETQPKEGIPVLVPLLILAIAGVITATVLVVRSGRGKLDDFDAD